jgi:hypothetical protein
MSVRENARRGLGWVSEGLAGDGLTRGAIDRGRRLAAGNEMSEDWFTMAAAWFARHEVDKQGEGFNRDDENYPSAGRVAWDLWGGDEGQSWAIRIRDQLEREAEENGDDGERQVDPEPEQRELPDNYRPALEDDVPEGRACGNCEYYNEDKRDGDLAYCERWLEYVRGDHYCDAWQPDEEDDQTVDDLDDDDVPMRFTEPPDAH